MLTYTQTEHSLLEHAWLYMTALVTREALKGLLPLVKGQKPLACVLAGGVLDAAKVSLRPNADGIVGVGQHQPWNQRLKTV